MFEAIEALLLVVEGLFTLTWKQWCGVLLATLLLYLVGYRP